MPTSAGSVGLIRLKAENALVAWCGRWAASTGVDLGGTSRHDAARQTFLEQGVRHGWGHFPGSDFACALAGRATLAGSFAT
jgi:hypothetical protein